MSNSKEPVYDPRSDGYGYDQAFLSDLEQQDGVHMAELEGVKKYSESEEPMTVEQMRELHNTALKNAKYDYIVCYYDGNNTDMILVANKTHDEMDSIRQEMESEEADPFTPAWVVNYIIQLPPGSVQSKYPQFQVFNCEKASGSSDWTFPTELSLWNKLSGEPGY